MVCNVTVKPLPSNADSVLQLHMLLQYSNILDMIKSPTAPSAPQQQHRLSNINQYSVPNGSCAMNSTVTSASVGGSIPSLVTQQQKSPGGVHQQQHVDLEMLTKTLKKDCEFAIL